MSRIPSLPALTLTAALGAACAQDYAPAADFMTGYEDVPAVTNTEPPPARLELLVSIGPKTLTDAGSYVDAPKWASADSEPSWWQLAKYCRMSGLLMQRCFGCGPVWCS